MKPSDQWRSPVDPERVSQTNVVHWQALQADLRTDQLTVEEPLEIRVSHQVIATVMRTPGHDFELACGFLIAEGLLHAFSDVLKVEYEVDQDGLPLPNVVNVVVSSTFSAGEAAIDALANRRQIAISTSCGLCGRDSITDLLASTAPLEEDTLCVDPDIFYGLSQRLRTAQTVFGYTGGLHAAGLFSLTGEFILLREDIGRHNAVDKLVGHGFLQHCLPYREHILLVSGRTSFEILQKALQARIPYVAAISAPSSLAVELAEQSGITLIGFLRDQQMNVYTHPERVQKMPSCESSSDRL